MLGSAASRKHRSQEAALQIRLAVPLLGVLVAAMACGGGLPSATPSPGALGTIRQQASPSPSPSCTPRPYSVKSGDTLLAIAVNFDVALEDVEAANGITNPDVLAIGQALTIPCPKPATPTAAASPSGSPAATSTAETSPTGSPAATVPPP